jgi:hypothetical protein
VEYKKRVADALPRRDSEAANISLSILSLPVLSWVDDLKAQYLLDPKLQLLMTQWLNHELSTCNDPLFTKYVSNYIWIITCHYYFRDDKSRSEKNTNIFFFFLFSLKPTGTIPFQHI